MRKVMALPDCVQTRGGTRDNPHLPPAFVASVEAEYAGTRLGRQELDGELLEDHEGALWTRGLIAECHWDGPLPAWRRVIVAVDPPASAGGDACGIVCVARGEDDIGYIAAGGTARDALTGLAAASGAWFAPLGGGLTMRDATVATPVEADPARDARDVAAADRAAAEVSVRYFDPGRDWLAGLQRARRLGVGPVQAIDLPGALSAGAAKGVAEAALVRGEADRTRRTLGVGLAALALVPGDVVSVTGEAGTWRVEAVALEKMAATLTLVPLTRAPAAARASGGRVAAAPDLAIGTTVLRIAELPALDEALSVQPRLTVWANGTGAGWRQAALPVSTDGGASWSEVGGTAAPAVMGTIDVPPGGAAAALVDRRNTLVVQLAHRDMTLADASAMRLDAGANLALVGDELLQFGRAEPLGDGRWRLSELWRARRGTDPSGHPSGDPIRGADATARPGDRFVLIDGDSARTIDLPLAALGGEVRVMASGVGDAMPVLATARLTGASIAPPAPVALRRDGDVVRWTRRSRAGWRWLDRVDAPLGEEREAYRVTLAAGGTSRELVVDEPKVALNAAERAGGTTIMVRQRGTYAESPPTTLTL